jgi:hypothetical protein
MFLLGTIYPLRTIFHFFMLFSIDIFLFSAASILALGHTQPAIQWVPRVISAGVTWLGREADHLLSYSDEVKNGGVIPPLLDTPS